MGGGGLICKKRVFHRGGGLGYNTIQAKGEDGNKTRSVPRSESRWLVRTGVGSRVDTGPGAAGLNVQ